VAAAQNANKVVIFGLHDDGTEGSDRGGNDQTPASCFRAGRTRSSRRRSRESDVVVVLNTGDAVYMPWLASVRSVLEMWYPGVAGGVATADVLVGNVTRAAKLPITFPGRLGRTPRFPTDDPGCNPAAIVIPTTAQAPVRTTATARSTQRVSWRNPPQASTPIGR